MGNYKITCNHAGCKNFIAGKEGFHALAKKHGYTNTGRLSFMCPLHSGSKKSVTEKPGKGKGIEEKIEREATEK